MQADSTNESQSLLQYLTHFVTPERLERIRDVISRRTRHLTLALENIYQPHNAAACIRSGDCFGIREIHVVEEKNSFEPAEGVSMGAEKWVDIQRYASTTDCCHSLKKQGYRIAAMTLKEGSIPINELDITSKTALFIGTELSGLSDDAHNAADDLVYLPMQGFTQSFNLSVCAALSLQILRLSLDNSDIDWPLSDNEQESLYLEWIKKSIRNADKLIEKYQNTPK